jgi:LysR family glycine cleavage system transcriptional activator
MRSILPSTTALRVFEAAARHLSCTGAADEVFLTQSAVSKQLRALEESLGVTLFVRVNRGLVLTELGRIYLDEIRPLLAQIVAASSRLATHSTAPSTLTLRILAILGDRWLLPRFSSFSEANPHINVQFTSLLSNDGFQQAEADGEFRFGEGTWPGFEADYLFGRDMMLVAAPSLLEKQGSLQSVQDAVRFPLLQHFQVPHAWAEIFSQHGCAAAMQASRAIRYEFYSTLLKATVAGMGLALVPRVFVQDEILRGDLVNPLAAGYSSRFGYYFVLPERKRHDPALAMFRAWLQRESEVTRRDCGETVLVADGEGVASVD